MSGANLLLSEKDVMEAEPVLQDSRVLLCQLEISNSTTLAALKLARKHNGLFTISCLKLHSCLRLRECLIFVVRDIKLIVEG